MKATIRIAALLGWVLLMLGVRLLIETLRPWAPELEMRLRHRAIRCFGRVGLAILGGRVTIEGAPPEPPYLLVSNHLSYLDVLVIQAAATPCFVAMAEMERWPLLGFGARHIQTIFVRRESLLDLPKVAQKVQAALDRGYGVCLFPEAGISQDRAVKPFRPALLDVASRNALPVHYASITYAAPPGAPHPHWTRGDRMFTHVMRLAGGPGFRATLRFGDRPITHTDRKTLARELTQAVTAMSG